MQKKHSHLTAHTEGLEWVETEPTTVPSLSEAVHKLGIERPLDGRQPHQDHMLLLGRKLISQYIVTTSAHQKNITDNSNKLEWST